MRGRGGIPSTTASSLKKNLASYISSSLLKKNLNN